MKTDDRGLHLAKAGTCACRGMLRGELQKTLRDKRIKHAYNICITIPVPKPTVPVWTAGD